MGEFAAGLDEAKEQSIRFLTDLIKFDTTNPPGNEMIAIDYLRRQLAEFGIESRIYESAPDRGNLVARLKANADAPPGVTDTSPLMLMGHVDVVEAVAADWSVDPFGGVVKDGYVWGRGALDMKNTVAQFLSVFLLTARSGLPLYRDIIFMANADEEIGGRYGARYMVENHWDDIACGAALNEGGGSGEIMFGQTIYTYQTAEKAATITIIRAKGEPGHGSIPHDDHAVVHLARAVAAVAAAEMDVHITPTVRNYIEGIARAAAAGAPDGAGPSGNSGADLKALLDDLLDPDKAHRVLKSPELAGLLTDFQRNTLRSMMTNSVAPNKIEGGSKLNVIPAVAEARFDTRIVPGQSAADVKAAVEAILEREGLLDRCEVIVPEPDSPALESPADHPLREVMDRVLKGYSPDASLVPFMLTGATDARFLRPKGAAVFGFSPMLPGEDLTRIHGIDERISLDSMRFGVEVVWDVIRAYCSPA